VSQKTRKLCNAIWLKIIRIDFDDTRQKYSKDSRIEFACVSFHVGLLFSQLFVFQTRDRVASKPSVIKIGPYNFELYCFKVCTFFSETQCTMGDDCRWTHHCQPGLRSSSEMMILDVPSTRTTFSNQSFAIDRPCVSTVYRRQFATQHLQ